VQQKFSSPLPRGSGIEAQGLTTAQARKSICDSLTRLTAAVGTPVKSSIDGSSGRSLPLAARHPLTPRRTSLSPVPRSTEAQTRDSAPENTSSPLPAWREAETSHPGFPQFERPSREFVLAQFLSFASAAEPPSFPPSLVRREQPQVDVNGHPPRSKSARSDSSRMGEQGTHLLLLGTD
jgi:hypothetical protein